MTDTDIQDIFEQADPSGHQKEDSNMFRDAVHKSFANILTFGRYCLARMLPMLHSHIAKTKSAVEPMMVLKAGAF